MTDSKGRYVWYELVTPDPGAAKRFYDSVVGWTIEAQPSGPMDYRMISRADGGNAGGVMRLTDEMRSHGARPIWLAYINVADVDTAVASIEEGGGKSLMPSMDIEGVGRIAMVADPQGAAFYIMTPTPPPGRPDAVSDVFSVDQPQHIRWNELATSDQDGAIDFYTRHFGWEQRDSMPMGEMGDYKFIWHGGVMTGAIMRKPDPMPVSLWTYYIGVDDIDRAAKAVTDGGGTILRGPIEIPGGEYSLQAIDPQQSAFGLVGPRRR